MSVYENAVLLTAKEARDLMALVKSEPLRATPSPAAISGLPPEVGLSLFEMVAKELLEMGVLPVLLATDAKEAEAALLRMEEASLPSHLYAGRDPILHPVHASHKEEGERLSVLSRLLAGERFVLVTTPEAALGYTLPCDRMAAAAFCIREGEERSPEALVASLLSGGFVPVDTVESAAQFSRRGGILDLCLPGEEEGLRVEFFGDEIDRISTFDLLDQRARDRKDAVTVIPVRECILDKKAEERIKKFIETQTKLGNEEVEKAYSSAKAALEGGGEVPGLDRFLTLAYPTPATLLDYLPKQTAFLLPSFDSRFSRAEGAFRLTDENIASLLASGLLPKGYQAHAPLKLLEGAIRESFALYSAAFSGSPLGRRLSGLFGFSCRHMPTYGDKRELLAEDLRSLLSGDYRVLLSCRSEKECEEITEYLAEAELPLSPALPAGELPERGRVLVVPEPLVPFSLPLSKVAILSLASEEGKKEKGRRRRFVGKRAGAGERILSYLELHEGDYVVHTSYGVGRFLGIESLTIDGVTADYITLQYAGEEKLMLRADRPEMLSRYIGAGSADGTVKLSRIGGAEWGRIKEKAKGAAREMAKDLIALYAKREREPGFAFAPDDDMERDFAAGFEYEETEPQRAAILEIKQDMMRPRPMDRLLCGDVGFGKTEVALRAVFKAVAGGKQAAILVPTTILALQHYQTCLSRMRGYPVTVEMLSRFKKPKERALILRRLARGEIDVIIGTHALLSSEVKFRDLGLLVVDEEQRFGVGQKEKIKTMASGVDVLTLTATPIPRTLNMAMNGIRDMSVLDEAPSDRYPVETYVLEHDDGMLEEAIRRELSRSGQVLYLCPRIEQLYRLADFWQKRLPEARIAVGHGQMDKDELEDVWQSLVAGEVDILFCTTIVETGVDLPGANTLIIEDADRLGLGQLHQLRGRVGRSSRRAYAFCTYRPGKALTDIARKRLEAIREYAEFGAGFRIALRDMELRGVGNLLGAEQHGHIDAVGYDLYVRLLAEAVDEERGTVKEKPFESVIDIRVDAYLPEGYITSSAHRMEMYKKLSLIGSEADRDDVLDELFDRFGVPPKPVMNLLTVALVRALAVKHRIERIKLSESGELRFHFSEVCLSAWSEAFALGGLVMHNQPTPYVSCRLRRGEDALGRVLEILTAYGRGKESEDDGR